MFSSLKTLISLKKSVDCIMFENSQKSLIFSSWLKIFFFSCFFEKLIENNIMQRQKMRLFRNIFTYCVFVSSHSSKYYSTSISVKPKKQNCVEILPFQFAQKLAFKTRNISQRLSKKILYRKVQKYRQRDTFLCCEWTLWKKKKKMPFFPYLPFSSPKYISQSFI